MKTHPKSRDKKSVGVPSKLPRNQISKLADVARTTFKSQMDLKGWLLERAQDDGLFSFHPATFLSDKDEEKVLESVVGLLACIRLTHTEVRYANDLHD